MKWGIWDKMRMFLSQERLTTRVDMSLVTKKVWPQFFQAITDGKKTFELRLNDFPLKEGDTLRLEEWDPETKAYTGRFLQKQVKGIIKLTMDDLAKFWPREEIEKKGFQVISI
ncbi:DUF3850 domain-containing protein [Candidatus Uhrbacteria bacterium]|nr:DUF3850 domain-containing protein [Candidatus Uhrbacteria bacterium]